ncbi:type I-C CRISPR-associated protein Cas7/Csd2 [Centipeda periodontii]|nr:type I-C CRISPR-associated protein Cas7/Csd2 [Centipeda periodontii]
MSALTKKIDFIGFITVERSNPNGDPLNGNQPRTDYGGYGEISDVCLKRKLRNRLQDAGEKILVQSNERADDGCDSIRSRVEANPAMEKPLKMKDKEEGRTRIFAEEACKAWMDVRAFGQVFALKEAKKQGVDSVSVGVRGPVTIHTAVSLDPVTITGVQITKSVNNEPGDKKGSDTMGMKYRVDFGVYKFQGSINVQLAEKTGFSEEDAQKVKEALRTIFENDASSARPEGSMEMSCFYWIEHSNKTGAASSGKVHRSVKAQKRDGVEVPSRFEDYVIDDSALYAIDGIHIEKYV